MPRVSTEPCPDSWKLVPPQAHQVQRGEDTELQGSPAGPSRPGHTTSTLMAWSGFFGLAISSSLALMSKALV